MLQKIKKNTLKREYKYDNGDYIVALEFEPIDLECEIIFDEVTSECIASLTHPKKGSVGDVHIPVDESQITDSMEHTFTYNNGIVAIKFTSEEESESETNEGDESTDNSAEGE